MKFARQIWPLCSLFPTPRASLGYAPLGLGLTAHSANCSPSPKRSVDIARYVWSPNPNGAYPRLVHTSKVLTIGGIVLPTS